MAKDIHELRIKLLDKIQHADSGADVIRLVDTAIKTLKENKANGYIIIRFIEKVNSDIENLKKTSEDQEELLKLFHTASTRLRSLKTQVMGIASANTH